MAPCPWQDLAEAESALAADREAYANGDQLKLGMYRRDNGELIGMVQLFNIDDVSRRGEIGYCLASAVQGRGYMDEALTCFIDYLAHTLHLRRLEGEIDPRNQGSARTLERQGFVLEGTLRARWCVAGELSDSGIYGLLLEHPLHSLAPHGVSVRQPSRVWKRGRAWVKVVAVPFPPGAPLARFLP